MHPYIHMPRVSYWQVYLWQVHSLLPRLCPNTRIPQVTAVSACVSSSSSCEFRKRYRITDTILLKQFLKLCCQIVIAARLPAEIHLISHTKTYERVHRVQFIFFQALQIAHVLLLQVSIGRLIVMTAAVPGSGQGGQLQTGLYHKGVW